MNGNRHKPRQTARGRRPTLPGASDPWMAASDPTASEQPVWLISYLDVMTLLFSFFVLLFAYQKSLTDEPVQSQEMAAVQAVGNADTGAETQTTAVAVATMKSQQATHAIARDAAGTRGTSRAEADSAMPMQLQPALEVVARLGQAMLPAATASEQTAAQLASAVAAEAAKKQVDILPGAGEVRLEVSDAILFDPASAALRAEGLSVLDRLAPVLAKQRGIIEVEGHTDNTPIASAQFPSNWELSAARATEVTRHLILKGVPQARLRAVGMAENQPRADNDNAAGRAKNRRVSLVLNLEGS